MEQWDDQGIVLKTRAHGENGAVVTLLTENYGRYVGYVQGGQSSKHRGMLEPGSLVSANWTAQTKDNLGRFKLEQERHTASALIDDRLKLSALLSACALCDDTMPEREAHSGLYHGFLALMEALNSEIWGAAYVMWEIALLRELGFGIELSRCAGGGDSNDLLYVSPKSGHAVSRAEGAPYKEKLLPLPAFLRPQKGDMDDLEVLKGIQMTGYFLKYWVFAQHSRGIPEERLRFEERFATYVDRENNQHEERDLVHGTG